MIFLLRYSLFFFFLSILVHSASWASLEREVQEIKFELKYTSPLSYEDVKKMIKEMNDLKEASGENLQKMAEINKQFDAFVLTQKNICKLESTHKGDKRTCLHSLRSIVQEYLDQMLVVRGSHLESIMKKNIANLQETKGLIKNNYNKILGSN